MFFNFFSEFFAAFHDLPSASNSDFIENTAFCMRFGTYYAVISKNVQKQSFCNNFQLLQAF